MNKERTTLSERFPSLTAMGVVINYEVHHGGAYVTADQAEECVARLNKIIEALALEVKCKSQKLA